MKHILTQAIQNLREGREIYPHLYILPVWHKRQPLTTGITSRNTVPSLWLSDQGMNTEKGDRNVHNSPELSDLDL